MTLPTTMTALHLTAHGGPEVLKLRHDVSVPTPGPTDVLIRVTACGMNNTDVNTRAGWYSKAVTGATSETGPSPDADDPTWGGAPISFPRIQGADVVGQVVATGSGLGEQLIGQRVIVDGWLRDWDDPLNRAKTGYFGSERDGGFAQYTVIDHRNVWPVTTPLTDAELATFACSYSTAEGMLARAQVTATDVVLITGASGGVGSALIQLAKRRGAQVVALAQEAKHADLARLGPDAILPRAPDNLPAALTAAIGRASVTVVTDIVGGPAFPALIETLDRGGRYTCSGAIAGPIVDLDLRTLYLRDLTFTGSTVIPPHIFGDLVRYIEAGDLTPMLAATYPLDQFHAGQAAFESKAHTGNIVVLP